MYSTGIIHTRAMRFGGAPYAAAAPRMTKKS